MIFAKPYWWAIIIIIIISLNNNKSIVVERPSYTLEKNHFIFG
jgi:hypothetical protein